VPGDPEVAVPTASLHDATLGGLRVLVEPAGDEAVALQLWVRSGAADEQPGEEGACHLLEHLVFRGPDGGTSPLAGRVEAEGGEVNAFTSSDNTVFFATVAPAGWSDALEALLTAVFEPSLDPAVLATERDVVLEEIGGVHEDASEELGAAVRAAVYGAHPYGRPITGTEEQVRRLDTTAVSRLHRRAFCADHAALVVSGAVDPGDVFERIRARALPRSSAPLPIRPPTPTGQDRRIVALTHPGVASPRFEVSWPGPPAFHPDRAALDVLAWCLVARASSEDRQAEPLETELWAPRQSGLFTAWAAALPDRVHTDLSATVRAARELCRRGVGRSELREARTSLLAQVSFSGEAVENRADRIGQGLADSGDPLAWRTWMRRLEALEPEGLRRVAGRWLQPDRLTAGVLSPDPTTTEEVEAAVRSALRGSPPRRPRVGLGKPPRATRHKVPAANRRALRSHRTDDGTWLVAESRPNTGVVSLQIALSGGRGIEPLSTPARLDLFVDAWTAETPRRRPAELEATLDRLGGDLSAWVDLDGIGWRLDFLSVHVGRALELAAELLLPPRFGATAVQEVRRMGRSSLGGRIHDAGTVASQHARSHLFAGHPWSMPAWGSPAALNAVTSADLREAWALHARADGAVLSLSGDLDTEQALDRMAALASTIPTGPSARPAPLAPAAATSLTSRVARGRGQVVRAWPGLSAGDEDLPALEVLTTLLSAQSGPLFEEVRERRGLAYDIDVSHTEGRLGGSLELRVATDPGRIDAVRTVLDETLSNLAQALTPDAARSAARLAAGRRRLDRQLGSVRAEERALSVVQGLAPSTPDGMAGRLEAIDPERLAAVCRRIIVPERQVESIVRPDPEGTEA
jgi:zinc protease